MKPPITGFNALLYPQGSITQYFGENPVLYSRFGLKAHNGIDIVAPHGTPLYAVEDGVVVDVKEDPAGFGKHIRFISDGEEMLGVRRQWVYGHNSKNYVKVGDRVKAGQHIADMGNTGFVISGPTPYFRYNPYAGTHLHLGLRLVKLSPRGWSYPNSPITFEVLNHDNGYKGAIDPTATLARTTTSNTKRQQMLTTISLLNTILAKLKKK